MSESPNPNTQNKAVPSRIRRRRFLGLGAGAAFVAAAHPVASAMSKLGSEKDDPGYLGTVTAVSGSTVKIELRETGEIVSAAIATSAIDRIGMPSVGQWIAAFGSREGDTIADADYIHVYELLDEEPVSGLKSRKFRFSRETRRMRYRGNESETTTIGELTGSTTDLLVRRTGSGDFDVLAAGTHPGTKL